MSHFYIYKVGICSVAKSNWIEADKAEAEQAPYLKAEAMGAPWKVISEGEKKRSNQVEAEQAGNTRFAGWYNPSGAKVKNHKPCKNLSGRIGGSDSEIM